MFNTFDNIELNTVDFFNSLLCCHCFQGLDEEALVDHGKTSFTTLSNYETEDLESHRAVYVGVHVPFGRGSKRRHRHRERRHHRKKKDRDYEEGKEDGRESPSYDTPSQRVQFILGTEDDDLEHIPHDLFTELDELSFRDGGATEWRETARWLKFEEDVEDGGERWSKPYVATLSLHSLFELRSCILNGTVMLDMRANSIEEIADMVIDSMVASGQLKEDLRAKVREAMLKKHHHQNERKLSNRIPLVQTVRSYREGLSSSRLSLHKPGLASSVSNLSQRRESRVSVLLNHLLPSSSSNTGLSPGPSPHSTPQNTPLSFRRSHLSPSQTHCTGPGPQGIPEVVVSPPEDDEPANSAEEDCFNSRPMVSPHSLPNNLDGNKSMERRPSKVGVSRENSSVDFSKVDMNFMKKIPPGAEASNVLVGEVDFLEKPIIAFVRLSPAVLITGLTEVPVPTRFLFLLLGPHGKGPQYHEIGRSMATLMTDEIFHDVAYKAKDRTDLLSGLDEFLDQVTVLPPGEWDPTIRIEPPKNVPSQMKRKRPSHPNGSAPPAGELEKEDDHHTGPELQRTGRIFGGLFLDVKRKVPFYWSDIKDSLNLQCLASILFLYCACMSPVITFGGLLGEATKGNIVSHTRNLLTLKSKCVYTTDASSLVCYITRFTEEAFAALICIIFIYEALEKLFHLGEYYPVNMHNNLDNLTFYSCQCSPPANASDQLLQQWNRTGYNSSDSIPWSNLNVSMCKLLDGEFVGPACGHHGPYIPDVLFWSIILFFTTFFLSSFLKQFKTETYFPTKVRSTISDFAVFLTIMIMVLVDYLMGIPSPKLHVPDRFEPTSKHRGWLMDPLGENPWWTLLVAAVPALLCTILVFMDQQITAVIINRKEHKLKKGCGYHLDLLIVAIMLGVCSIMGLPWFVAATVLSISHVNSLKVESGCSAPGEQPKFLGIREQRVTGFMIFSLMGCSVFMTSVLKFIPMPVLYGVFLYMGVSSLKGIQFFDRIKLFGMPAKHQPDLIYLRYVPLWKVHVFTLVQLTCLVLLWVIKASAAAVVFPMMVLALVFIRKLLDLLFTNRELSWLDDLMPESKKKTEDDKKKKEEEEEERKMKVRFEGSNRLNIPVNAFSGR
uniref:Uncharacterized protein n=1 Tax=Xiphophorus couchianus TaxID=32473 RepID=A0A3B5MPG5_9TELE